jgi:hypothetical protein
MKWLIQELVQRPAVRIGPEEQEDRVTAEYGGTIPKIGNRVGITGQSGLFEVVDVNMLMQTANLKATDGQGHVTRNVPWTSLKFQGAASR